MSGRDAIERYIVVQSMTSVRTRKYLNSDTRFKGVYSNISVAYLPLEILSNVSTASSAVFPPSLMISMSFSLTATAIFPEPQVKNCNKVCSESEAGVYPTHTLESFLKASEISARSCQIRLKIIMNNQLKKIRYVAETHSWMYLQPIDWSDALENAGRTSTTPSPTHSARSESEYK